MSYNSFFPLLEFFFLTFSLIKKNSNVQPALDAWKHMVFVHVLKKFISLLYYYSFWRENISSTIENRVLRLNFIYKPEI